MSSCFARESGFAEQRMMSLADEIQFSSLGISIPLSVIYRNTGLKSS